MYVIKVAGGPNSSSSMQVTLESPAAHCGRELIPKAWQRVLLGEFASR